MRSKLIILVGILIFLFSKPFTIVAQTDSSSQYLMGGVGLNLTSSRYFGARAYVDYSKEFAQNWLWGIGLEMTRGINFVSVNLLVNHEILSGNIYRNIDIYAERLYLRFGAGLGLMHVSWEDSDRFAPTVNISGGMHIKVSRNVWITTSLFPILVPVNRITYAPLEIEGYADFLSVSLLNLGVQVRL